MNNYEIAGTIIQVLTVFGLIYSLYLTRREFVVHERPYVGFIEILKKHSDKTNELEFNVLVNNTGNIPAKNARLFGKFKVSGEGEAEFECETKGSIFPSTNDLPSWIIGLKDVDKDAVLKGEKELKLSMTLEYYGISKSQFKTTTIRTYDPMRDKWIKEEGDWS